MSNEPYYKTDIAHAYYPHLRPSQALRQLKRKIRSKTPLEKALFAIGYRHEDRSPTFSDLEVEVIKKYLGDCQLRE